jgi:hypothetical protein
MKNLLRISGVLILLILIHSCSNCKDSPYITGTEITNITSTSATVKGKLINTCKRNSISEIIMTISKVHHYGNGTSYYISQRGDGMAFTQTITSLLPDSTYYVGFVIKYEGHYSLFHWEDYTEYSNMIGFKTLPSGRK